MTNSIAEKLASPYYGAQASPQIGLNKGDHWGPVPAPAASGKDGTAAHLQSSTQDDNPHQP